MPYIGRRCGVWKAEVNWLGGKVNISPYWRFALPAWLLPALIGEWTVQCMGGQVIGVIAGGSVSLLKSYHDFYRLMGAYVPVLSEKIRWTRIAVAAAFVMCAVVALLLVDVNLVARLLGAL